MKLLMPRRLSLALLAAAAALVFALRTASGTRATSLKAGAYVLTVRDRSKTDNFHLRGKGVNASTGVAFTGSKTWKIRLAKGTYRYSSDAHPALKGTVKVR